MRLHPLTGKKIKKKPYLPEDTVEILKEKNLSLQVLIDKFELNVRY